MGKIVAFVDNLDIKAYLSVFVVAYCGGCNSSGMGYAEIG
jgi:hypothetical protein